MDCQNIVFSRHAIQQMFLRRISKRGLQAVVAYGEVIEENPDDTRFPVIYYLIL
jgi:hypothetical protein